jgi:Uma2 family endonuclease
MAIMATELSIPAAGVLGQSERRFTVADLEFFPTDLPSGPIDFELDEGRLVPIMAPPGDLRGGVQVKLSAILYYQSEALGYGKVRTEVGVMLSHDPETLRAPDVMFIANKSLPIRTTSQGYLETIPELVVEIRSKNDSLSGLQEKVEKYLAAGVEIVWVADASDETVSIHTAGAAPIKKGVGEVLTLPELVPTLSIPVAELFKR